MRKTSLGPPKQAQSTIRSHNTTADLPSAPLSPSSTRLSDVRNWEVRTAWQAPSKPKLRASARHFARQRSYCSKGSKVQGVCNPQKTAVF